MNDEVKGLELLTAPTGLITQLPESPPDPEPKKREPVKLGAKHKEHIAWLSGKGYGVWDESAAVLNTHTCHVEEMVDHFTLPGDFTTNATGKDGAVHGRNCCLVPLKRGLWLCVRYGDASEDGPGWTKNRNGHYQIIVGKEPSKAKVDHADTMVADARAIDTFSNWEGCRPVQVIRRGRKETLLVGSDTYARMLRVRYQKMHGLVAKAEWVRNSIDQLTAIAIEEGEEIPVYVRLAHVKGKLFIDLADRERRIVEIDADGWRVVDQAPVQFLRTDKMRPLPIHKPAAP